jgi:hypothetical protein
MYLPTEYVTSTSSILIIYIGFMHNFNEAMISLHFQYYEVCTLIEVC